VFELFIGKDCSVKDSILVGQASPEIDYALMPQDTITCINRSVMISPDSMIGVVNIQWLDSGSNSSSLEVNEAGTYPFILYDKNGCTIIDSINVEENLEKPSFVVSVDTINCITNLGGFNIANPGNFQFVWSGQGQNFIGINPSFDKPGNYIVIATGVNGCTETQNLELPSSIDYPKITETIVPITCSNPNGSIQLATSIASTFTWNSNATNGSGPIITSNVAGSYDIIATSDKGCKSTVKLSIPVDTLRPQINPVTDILLTCKNPEQKLTLDVSSYDVFMISGPGLPNIPSVLPTLIEKGLYTLSIKNNQNGCTNTTTFNVNEDKKKPKFAAAISDLSCKNPSSNLTLSGDPGLDFDIDGTKITNGFLISRAGNYTIKATNAAGCDTVISLDVKGNFDLPVISLSPILLNCHMPQQWIKDLGNESGLTYTWETDNGNISKDSILITQNSNITLVATNAFGCVSKLIAVINTDFAKPTITIDGPRSIPCKASSIILTGITNDSNNLWTWSNTSGNIGNENTLNVSMSDIYTILVKNLNNGCTESANITIEKQPSPEDFTIDLIQPQCFGDKGNLTWTGTKGGTAPYSLNLNNIPLNLNKKTEIASGRFTLYLKDVNGCDLEKLIEIENPIDFLVNAGRDTIIQLGNSHQIKALSDISWSEISEILWEPATALSCTDCPDPVATPETDTEYTITIKDKNGCIRNDIVNIRLKVDKGWVAPNMLNPNSTSGNQRFTIYPEYESIENIKTLKIYDRWGNMVFTTQNIPAGDPALGWDGTLSGRKFNPGVFIWVAELEYKDKSSAIAKGDVTIIH
jgi:CHU_C Type IX secretion signal domain